MNLENQPPALFQAIKNNYLADILFSHLKEIIRHIIESLLTKEKASMDKFVSLQVFKIVAEQRSFVSAARRLQLSPGMVSKHIMALESSLGTRLLNRTSRNVSLTEAGNTYLDHISHLLGELDEVESSISKAVKQPKGTLRFTAPVWATSDLFMGVLQEFQERYPEVDLDIDLSGRIANLVEDGFDLALRASSNLGDHYIARPITEVPFCLVASPGFIERHGQPTNTSELAQFPALWWYQSAPKRIAKMPEGFFEPTEALSSLQFKPRLTCNNESLLHQAALRGMGITTLPHWMVKQDLDNQRLIELLPGKLLFKAKLQAIYPSRRFLSSKVRCFIDFLTENDSLKVASKPE